MQRTKANTPISLVEVFRVCASAGQADIVSAVSLKLRSALPRKEKSRWAQAALALTPYKDDDATETKMQNLKLMSYVAEVSSKEAGSVLKRAQEYVGDPDWVVRAGLPLAVVDAAQHLERAGDALALVQDLASDPNEAVRVGTLTVAAAAARHPEHAGAALASADHLKNDRNCRVREDVLRVAEVAAEYSEHTPAALALVDHLKNDPNKAVRDLARSILEDAKPKPEGGKPAVAAGAAPAP